MYKRFLPWIIALYCIVFVINGGLKDILSNLRDRYVLITTSFYALLAIGVLYSSNVSAGLFDLEVKFSLLLFPVLFSARRVSKKELYQIFLWFIIGCLVAVLICVTAAFFYYQNSANVKVFYYQDLSVFQHPSYFAMYLNFCIFLIYYYMVFDRDINLVKSNFIMVSIIVIFSFFIVLLSSKVGLITLFMVIFAGTFLWFLKSRAIFPSIIIFVMLSTMIYASFTYSNYIQSRIEEAVNSISDEKVTFTTTGARLVIWDSALKLFSESPVYGYGTGDVRDVLVADYVENEYHHLAEVKLNAHNQYIQITLALGLLGLILFSFYLLYPALSRSFWGNAVYVAFLALNLMNYLPESMLETQAGVVFYAFFNSLLYFNQDKIVPLKLRKEK